jgi:adenylyltransferase/sulfurtransferase
MDLSPDLVEGRYHRQELIEWWDQARLDEAKVLVVGAGALGNEILKNLALVGIGSVVVADMDRVERSNLSRSVFFREDDIGRAKAEAVAGRYRELNPNGRIEPFVGDAVHGLGAGVYRWADVVVAGLDNREARVAVNRTCMVLGRPWIDGAIERLDGVMRVFLPDGGACYECTMNEVDWQMLAARRSCTLLGRDAVPAGHSPTTATISSIVAGLQCQEVLRLLHGHDVAGGEGIVVNGLVSEVYRVSYPRLDDCAAHEPLADIVELPATAAGTTVGELLERARADLGPEAALELGREVLQRLECPGCRSSEELFISLATITESTARCPACGVPRIPHLMHAVTGVEGLGDRTLSEIGVPAFDMVLGRAGLEAVGYLMAGDAPSVLGAVAAQDAEGL